MLSRFLAHVAQNKRTYVVNSLSGAASLGIMAAFITHEDPQWRHPVHLYPYVFLGSIATISGAISGPSGPLVIGGIFGANAILTRWGHHVAHRQSVKTPSPPTETPSQ